MKKFNSNSISRNNKYNGAGGAGGGSTASDIAYDNSFSGLVSENVQQAIDELHDEIEIGNIYTTDEKKVGEWIDGKPLYRKVVTCSSVGETTTGLSGVDVKYMDGFINTSIGVKLPLNAYSNDTDKTLTQITENGAKIAITMGTNWAQYFASSEIIIYYTK